MRTQAADTKTKLADALERMMSHTPIDTIRVSDIATNAETSKQTFYYHFQDKYDLMEYCYRRLYGQTLERMGPSYSFSQACLDLYGLYRVHRSFMCNGFKSSDPNNLTAIMNRVLYARYAAHLQQCDVAVEGAVAFALEFYVVGGVELTKKWALDGMKMPDAEIVSMWLETIPKNLAPYFE